MQNLDVIIIGSGQGGVPLAIQLAGRETLEGEALLVAAGRKPNTAALNAAAAGIQVDDKGFVQVNARLETTRPGVYAIGEAAGQPACTHVSWENHRRLWDIINDRPRSRDDRVLGYGVFYRSRSAGPG